DLLDDCPIQTFLAAEIILNGRKVDAGTLCYRPRRGAFEAAGGEQLERSFQYAQASLFAALVRAWPEAADGDGHSEPRYAGGLLYRSIANVNRSIHLTDG